MTEVVPKGLAGVFIDSCPFCMWELVASLDLLMLERHLVVLLGLAHLCGRKT
jgi:hypothetical protein